MSKIALLAAFAALALTAACSGGGGGSKAKATDPFTAQANALCSTLAADDAAGRAALGPSPSSDALATYVRGSFVPEAIGTYQQIGGLAAPAADADKVKTLLTDVIAEVKLIQQDPAKGGNKPHQRELRQQLAAVGLTACGTGFAPDLDKAEFIAEAGPICLDVYTKIGDETRKRGISNATPADVKAAFVSSFIVPLAQNGLSDLRAIGAPRGDEQTISSILDDLGGEITDLGKDPSRYGLIDARHLRIQAAWHAYGVDSCALYTGA